MQCLLRLVDYGANNTVDLATQGAPVALSHGGTAWESFGFIVRGHGAGRRYRVAVEFEANGRRNIAMRGAGRGIAMAVAAAALVTATSAAAHTYVVTKRSDPTPNGCHRHNCSLREAILAANHHPGV